MPWDPRRYRLPQDSHGPCSTLSRSRGAEPESEGTEPSRGPEAALGRSWAAPSRGPLTQTMQFHAAARPLLFPTGEEVNPLLRGDHPQLHKLLFRARPKAPPASGHPARPRSPAPSAPNDVQKTDGRHGHRPQTWLDPKTSGKRQTGPSRTRTDRKRMRDRQESRDWQLRCTGLRLADRSVLKSDAGP